VRRQQSAGRTDHTLVNTVLDALPSPTVLLDPDGVIVMANSAWTDAGVALGESIPTGVNYYAAAVGIHDDPEGHALVQSLRELARGELPEVSVDRAVPSPADGSVHWYHVQATRVDLAGHVVVSHTDVTDRVLAERASLWQARHDHLTGLPNRAHLHDLIDAELHGAAADPVAVLFLDVDGFKDINDSLGHEAGDELLRQLTARLVERTRGEDTVGRLGGDEFVVLCRNCDTDGAEVMAQRFRSSFDRPFTVAGRLVRLTVSIGIAGVPAGEPALRSTDLVRDADLAMYASKAAGRNRVRVFSPDLRDAAQRRMDLAAELREAIADNQLVLHYQPVLQLPSGDVAGAEALVRWQHPERGLIPPGEFIPLAEQSDLIRPLTRWVLGEATRQAAEWVRGGLPMLIGVNVSAAALSDGTLLDDVLHALAMSGLAPEHLIVELTESSVAEDAESAAAQFAALRRTGVEVAIDDFGAGYSSLGQLINIPAGILKIDRSLVMGAADRPSQSAAAIAAVVGLAQACGMRSLAEGVETADQLAQATELGCTYVQGFFIARPMPGEEIENWIRARSAHVLPV
jgi:diguanylate cyclase (GGDEF)-like protein